MINTEQYWEQRYKNKDTGWDMKSVSPALKAYFDQRNNKQLQILIPGAGNAYEAEYLFLNEFENVFVTDIAKTPLENLRERVPDFPESHLWQSNIFDIEGEFDLIIEQTFFCALPPQLRREYAKKMHALLKPEGKLTGLLFDFPLTKDGPPFGGSKSEYLNYFEPLFEIKTFERCHNSHPKRQGKELFFQFIKK